MVWVEVDAHLNREPVGVHGEVPDDDTCIIALMNHLVDFHDGRVGPS